jgi:ABC-2 type transport system ATP-binding protein
MTALIEAEGLVKSFGDIQAVDGISLQVRKGEVLGFLGPNGAGKSTTMKMITGFLEPDAGSARICGIDIAEQPKLAKARFGYLPEGAPSYAEMTPRGFLGFIAQVRGYRGADVAKRVDIAAGKAALESVLDQPIDTLSKGYRRRVGLAQAILHDPAVLIMDEPTDGLDPNQKHHVRELISGMAEDKAIIISTHILEEVEAVCSRAVVINKGRVVADGTAEDLMQRLHYHGAVSFKVAAERADAAIRVLASAGGIVERVETVGKPNGHAHLRAIPKNRKEAADHVAALLRAKDIPVDELYIERGRLDDVFRQITSPNKDEANAA